MAKIAVIMVCAGLALLGFGSAGYARGTTQAATTTTGAGGSCESGVANSARITVDAGSATVAFTVPDGCTGVAVLSNEGPMEVQFDEHKLLVVYAGDLRPFQILLEELGIERDDKLKLITEGEHMHSTDPSYRQLFEQLCYRLGVGKAIQRVSW